MPRDRQIEVKPVFGVPILFIYIWKATRRLFMYIRLSKIEIGPNMQGHTAVKDAMKYTCFTYLRTPISILEPTDIPCSSLNKKV